MLKKRENHIKLYERTSMDDTAIINLFDFMTSGEPNFVKDKHAVNFVKDSQLLIRVVASFHKSTSAVSGLANETILTSSRAAITFDSHCSQSRKNSSGFSNKQ
jgi:hypothetical protein